SAHALCLPFPIIAAGFLLARPVLAQVSDRPQSAEEPETATSQPVDDDWALVQDAQNRLARHDFAGAIRQLDRVEPQSDAAFDARLVRQQIQDALRPHLRG